MSFTGSNEFGHNPFDNTTVQGIDGMHDSLISNNNNYSSISYSTSENNAGYDDDHHNNDSVMDEEDSATGASKGSCDNQEGGSAMNGFSNINKIDILHHLVNTLNGKDKFAKTLKYSLDLIIYFLSIKPSMIMKNKWLRNLTFTMIKNLIRQLSYVSTQLSTYRYILRFGNSPFLIIKFIERCKILFKGNFTSWSDRITHLGLKLFNESSFKELLNIYFSICDEVMLLNRFRIWSHPKLERIISRHEVISWQIDIFLNLKDNMLELETLKRNSLECNIEKNLRQVNNNLYPNQFGIDKSATIDEQLAKLDEKILSISQKQYILKLDITRLLFDALANSTDFFKLKVSSGTYSSLSLCSSIISLIKLWAQTKQDVFK